MAINEQVLVGTQSRPDTKKCLLGKPKYILGRGLSTCSIYYVPFLGVWPNDRSSAPSQKVNLTTGSKASAGHKSTTFGTKRDH